MKTLLSRRRYEVVALFVALVCVGLHQATARPMTGLDRTNSSDSWWTSFVRVVQTFEGRATDYKFRLRGARQADPGVVVVEVDEKSVQKYGLWPWPRSLFGKAIDAMVGANTAAIGLDVTFTDAAADPTGPTKAVLAKLRGLEQPTDDVKQLMTELEGQVQDAPDDVLARAFRAAGPKVVQGVIPFAPTDRKGLGEVTSARSLAFSEKWSVKAVPGKVPGSQIEIPSSLALWANGGVIAPLDAFATAGSNFGHFGAVFDIDGTVRRSAALTKLQTDAQYFGVFPSMAVQSAAVAMGARIVPVLEDATTLDAVRLLRPDGSFVDVPMEGQSAFMLINYPGSSKSFSRVSIGDLIDGTFDKKQLEGKVALVGVTIVGSSGDQRTTPFNEFESGIITHAAVVSNILSGDFLRRPFELLLLEHLSMLLLALTVAVLVSRAKSFFAKGLFITGSVAGWLVVDFVAFSKGYQVATLWPVINAVVSSFAVVFLGYFSGDRDKARLRSTFTRYLGEDVMEAALTNPDRLNIGEKREMSVLFSDIRGFTSLSERMSPEALASFINQYLSPMTKIVFEEKGTLDKYIGDAVMAFWNAPLDQADHAVRACRAAVHMLIKLDELKEQWRKEGLPELEIGIGVNTGQMIVGNMGSDVRVDYTVLGDSVNLGARLEGTNKEYDTKIIISEFTYKQAKHAMVCRHLGAVRVKGKKLPVEIYELRAEGQAAGDEAKAINAFEGALVAMRARQFEQAEKLFQEVLTVWKNDAPSVQYLEELAEYRQNPPGPEWDGVVTMKTK